MLTLEQLAKSLDGVWHGNANHAIFGLSSLSRATSKDLTYFDNPLLQNILEATSAGAVLIRSEHLALCPVNSIVVSNPRDAMSEALNFFSVSEFAASVIHETAQIHPSATVGKDVSIGAHCVVGEGVHLADGVRIGAGAVISPAVAVGTNSYIGCGVVIHSGSLIGDNVLINSGCIIGASPYNYLKHQGTWKQGPDLGGVVISEGVHVGANTVIDRGSLSDTFLAKGVCIDNLVQIAHDVCIGANTAIAGCAAIGAHVQIGADCIIGGASSIAAFVDLVDDVVITGMSTVIKSIHKPGIYTSGTIAHEHDRWRRNAARFKRLDDYITKLSALEQQIIREL